MHPNVKSFESHAQDHKSSSCDDVSAYMVIPNFFRFTLCGKNLPSRLDLLVYYLNHMELRHLYEPWKKSYHIIYFSGTNFTAEISKFQPYINKLLTEGVSTLTDSY